MLGIALEHGGDELRWREDSEHAQQPLVIATTHARTGIYSELI